MKILHYFIGMTVLGLAFPIRDTLGILPGLVVLIVGLYVTMDGGLKPENTANEILCQMIQIITNKEVKEQ